jgi:hypothetical protein
VPTALDLGPRRSSSPEKRGGSVEAGLVSGHMQLIFGPAIGFSCRIFTSDFHIGFSYRIFI